MQVSKTIEAYNKRRYGTPWAAHITAFDGRPTLDFVDGAYNGTDAGGELVIDAESGEVIKIGQKDHRGNGGSNDFYQVGGDGTLEQLDAAAARKAWIAWRSSRHQAKIVVSLSELADTLGRDGWGDAQRQAILGAVKAAGIATE
jgi:hypothetical protein